MPIWLVLAERGKKDTVLRVVPAAVHRSDSSPAKGLIEWGEIGPTLHYGADVSAVGLEGAVGGAIGQLGTKR